MGLPGASAQLNRIEAGTSSSSVLGLLETADANRTRALGDLATREDANRQQQQRNLTGLLGKQAGYQDRDQQEFDKNKAALTEASERNKYGAVNGASQLFAYYLKQAQQGKGSV